MAIDGMFNGSFGGGGGAAKGGGGAKGGGKGGIGGAGLFSFLGLAGGGQVRGPGSGTSDSIPAMLSNGEYVVRAKQAEKHMALLEAINSGHLPAFAQGGVVGKPKIGNAPAMRGGGGDGDTNQHVTITQNVTVNASGGTPEANHDLAKKVSKEVEASIRGMIWKELKVQRRPGNMLNY